MFTRDLYHEVEKHLPKKEYAVIAGARQVGKTTLMKQLYEKLRKENIDAWFFTLEDPDVLKAINTHPERLFDLTGKTPGGKKRMFVFLDEVQYADDPSRFLKYLYDTYGNKLKLVCSSSSAFYIDKKFKDSLAGRKRLFEMYTLSFAEVLGVSAGAALRLEWENACKKKKLLTAGSRRIRSLFDLYLTYGGYPAVVLENDTTEKKRILKELVITYIKRDVMESGITEQAKFHDLLRILASQCGELLNTHELGNTLRLAHGTVDNHLHILKKCFHIHSVPPFYRNLRKEISKIPKVYFNDLGLRNILLGLFMQPAERMDKGALIENYVYIRLRQLYGTDALRFWRTTEKNEVDFVLQSTFYEGRAYEVKYSDAGLQRKKYKSFTEAYPALPLNFIAYEVEGKTVPVILL